LPVSDLALFQKFLRESAARYGRKQDFAKAIGISPGRFSRLQKGSGSMEVENCLRLAAVTKRSPAEILRLAGKGSLAEMIEGFYGAQSAYVDPMDDEARQLWNDLNDRQRASLVTVMREYLGREPSASAPGRTHVAGRGSRRRQ
jgi:transcriptional regulator with XRE-family HTH domain